MKSIQDIFILKMGLLVTLTVTLQAEPYVLGQGIAIKDMMNIGGYFSSELEINKNKTAFSIEDVAVIAYGEINPMFSYLAELESINFYHKDILNGDSGGNQRFHIERFYGDLWLVDAYNIRFGKQITPIGYWNKEPINVLRDTTSNPLYSTLLFPKFITGIDINGYIPNIEGLNYHLFGQNNHDFDDEYINIPNAHFFGLSVEKELSLFWNCGGSIGEYISTTSQKSRYIQTNAKYDNSEWQVMGEALIAKSEYVNKEEALTLSAYVQSVYRYTFQDAFVARVEYFNDHHTHYKNTIATLGYSYRPWYPVSLKGEYQFHSLNNENRALFSFSVLF